MNTLGAYLDIDSLNLLLKWFALFFCPLGNAAFVGYAGPGWGRDQVCEKRNTAVWRAHANGSRSFASGQRAGERKFWSRV